MGFKEDLKNAATKVSGAYKKYSKTIVTVVIILNVLFTATMVVLLVLGHEEPDTLIVEWFTFTGKELLALAGIKIADTASETISGFTDKPNKSDIEE